VSIDIWPMERAQGLLGSDLLIIQLWSRSVRPTSNYLQPS